MKYHKQYGCLIVTPPPFNVLTLPLVIPFSILKDPWLLKKMNKLFTQIVYFPLSIVFTLIFMLINLICTPLAYVFACAHKWKLILKANR